MATTLREFIKGLEEMSENGKNDNLPVVVMDNDEECHDVEYYCIDRVYPQDITDPHFSEKCVMIT